MQNLKQVYNHLLQRYYNGCDYLEAHPEETERYMPVVLEIKKTLEQILERIPNATTEEILNGFKE